ncbi:hypothetical protein HPP92_000006 [Vanilla planifolia]|uniref:AB hydrolase-1 domain-containing protein n=1 Tax=Vanilla planifolia TaxID=51239 RepID=A0A835RVL5_VANPL|nr:hypothetical protein HPP92_000006 [Vanilla planifolia]
MASAGVSRKISAASARAHTRKKQKRSSLGVARGVLAWAYRAARPPPPKICGMVDGPPVTSARINLKDGRHLSYIEIGVPKDKARHKIIFIHGFDSSKHDVFPVSEDMLNDMGIYLLSFDRPGYGESDPNLKISIKSIAEDIEELVDKVELGPKFHVIGFSLGGAYVWSCLKYIPHRLAGAAIIAPASNYWWSNFPANLSKEAFSRQLVQDQWVYRVAHYFPWLTYWWNTQKFFPASSIIASSIDILSESDKQLLPSILARRQNQVLGRFLFLFLKLGSSQPSQDEVELLRRKLSPVTQVNQDILGPRLGSKESSTLHLDLTTFFGSWEFDPMDLKNPFPGNEASVHLWHGDHDRVVDASLSRYIGQKLPWIRYHEVPGKGHMFPYAEGTSNAIVKTLLLGDD